MKNKIQLTQTENLYERVLRSTALLIAIICTVFGLRAFADANVETAAQTAPKELPIYCVTTDKPQIALTFDAAWGNEDTTQILDTLAKENVKVTFFMTGGWVSEYPDDVRAILAAGHDLGNHSENHKNMSQLSKSEVESEVLKTHEKVKELTGYSMTLFRPPYGDYDNKLITTLKELNYYPIQWDVDSLDWKDYGRQAIIDKVTNHKNLGNGSIILCHNGAKYTAQALPEMIKKLKAMGYEFVPLSQLIHKGNYTLDYTGRQIPG